MIKKSKKYYIITSVFIFVMFFISSNVFASNYEAYGEQLVSELMSSGELDGVAERLLSGGFLSAIPATQDEIKMGDPYYGFIYNVNNLGSSSESLLTEGKISKTIYDGLDEYSKELVDLYCDFYDIIKNSNNELIKCLVQSQKKSKGGWENKNNNNFITYLISNLILQYSENIKQEWDKAGCSDKDSGSLKYEGGSFKYNGKKYSCSSLTYAESTNHSGGAGGYAALASGLSVGGQDISAIRFTGITKSKKRIDTNSIDNVTCVDKQEKKKKENKDDDSIKIYVYGEVIGSAPENEKTTVEIIELDEMEKYSFGYNLATGKEPSLINAIKYSTEASKAGELVLNVEGSEVNFSSQFSESLIEPLIDIVLQYGKYIVYAALLFFGVRAIFSGAKGKSDFKAILPYLLIALVFFYSGRGIVDMIKEIYEESVKYNSGNTYDQNAYNEFLSRIFSTVVYIVRILAFAGIIFAGLKYMFTSPSEKAQMKKTMLAIVIGCIFVFSSTFVVNLVVGSLNEAGFKNDIEITDGS